MNRHTDSLAFDLPCLCLLNRFQADKLMVAELQEPTTDSTKRTSRPPNLIQSGITHQILGLPSLSLIFHTYKVDSTCQSKMPRRSPSSDLRPTLHSCCLARCFLCLQALAFDNSSFGYANRVYPGDWRWDLVSCM